MTQEILLLLIVYGVLGTVLYVELEVGILYLPVDKLQ